MRDNYLESAAHSATRLRSKKITKLLAVSFAVMALLVQLASGVLPGESNKALAQTASSRDHIVTGGFKTKEQMLGIYDANKDAGGHTDIKQIYTQFGVSRQDIVNAKEGYFNTNDFNGQLKALGRQNHGVSNRYPVKIAGTNTTIYTGGWLDGYNQKPWKYKALIGQRQVDGKWFAIMHDCGNIVYVDEPKKPEPPVVKDIQVCDLATKKIVTIKENQYDNKKHSKNLDDCKVKPVEKTIEVCDLTTKKMVTIKESEFDSKKYSKDANDCKVAPVEKTIQVCDLTTKKVVTIKESEYDTTKHSKNLDDCKEAPVVKNIEVCELSTKEMVTIKESEFDATKHSQDAKDCAEEVPAAGPAPVTPVEQKPEQPAPVELPKTGIADGLSGLFGLGSIVAAAGYYVSSRRSLLATLLNR